MYHIFTKILSSTTVFNIDNNLFIITTISEGSCDTEDAALSSHNIHFKHIKIETVILIYSIISQYYSL